ncbi:hypothetical protein GCM10011374_36250 [Kocuria dechangensis]|uniref:Uncharacterized protein n=1 Tax=Kocuria dechangensis TaxID=1176249 RepID=A0A917M028_9MICC|nr:hypothetical protein [Kocuria dechangensis]GGG68617.1 hypothetical protein GCM10011374_36250 [Kocuria dechangensis]
MDINELRASLLEGLGVSITEQSHEEIGEEPITKLVITAPWTLMPAMTDWLDATDTGRMVEMSFTGDRGRPAG